MKPLKGNVDPSMADGICAAAERLADAWVTHVWNPNANTTCLAYVDARKELVRLFYPGYELQENGDRPKRKRKNAA